MTQLLQLGLALSIGVGASVQVAMLGAIGRDRGAVEAGWLSIFGTVAGIAAVLAIRSARGDMVDLPIPFDRWWIFAVIGLLSVGALVLAFQGPSAYLAGVGLFGAAFIVGGAALAPKLGVALLFSVVTAGTLVGALVMDHVGAFGNEPQRVTLLRLVGVLVVLGGVVIVRWR